MPSETDYAWTAGLLDGDGCVTMRRSGKHFRHPQVRVDSCDLEILHHLRDLHGGNLVAKRDVRPGHRPAYSWNLYGARNVLRLLAEVVPYMHCPAKVARARLLLEEYSAVTSRNGFYTAEQRVAKLEMEERFMVIGFGRGASSRQIMRSA
jgi:hypothetical protein